MELGFLQRCNRCAMNGNTLTGRARPLTRNASRFPCFYRAFEYMDGHPRSKFNTTYELHMYKQYNNQDNNFVVLNKKNMCRLLNSFKQITPFKFHFEETETEYILVMTLIGTGLQHKALLMLSRTLFEYPHNLCAADALKLRELGHLGDVDLKPYSLISLYLLCLSSTYFSTGESFINEYTPKLYTNLGYWRDSLKVLGDQSVSEVTPYKNYPRVVFEQVNTVEEITSEEGFNSRLEIYSTNLRNNLNA